MNFDEAMTASEDLASERRPGTLHITTNWDYARCAGRSPPAREASRDAVELAARIVRDRPRLALAGIDAIREAALLSDHVGCSYMEAALLLSATPAAPDSAEPAPHLSKRATIAAALFASGRDRAEVVASLCPTIADRSALMAELAPREAAAVRLDLGLRAFVEGEGQRLLDAGDDDAPVWIQLAKQGSFAGHPSGPFKLDARVFADLIRNFKANEDGRIPIDFEHSSEHEPTAGTVPTAGAPAQGWIIDMATRPDGNLWALVEWHEPARTYVREGKYRFISPAISFHAKDRSSGKPIGAYCSSAGLTNSPFLSGMQPLAAKATGPATLAQLARIGHTALSMRILREQGLTLRASQEQASACLRGEIPYTVAL